ncbi:trehalose 6-phosphate synthase [Jatrophihabitans endophyticus]|uniref:Trehalose 6-phosphate synthase n=1 Tax=Jatrophihabitans endophyticus TaxID=1206085 RepID=A0A1M5LC40_9ACTN|nr:trehalose-6-phosphate synthase [Jatrophihabitans endophyticus]SHG62289.1 trehalose 6-phosphate synthase [Jatrophihabitans endophyticus]
MSSEGHAQLLVASNRGPLSIVAGEGSDDDEVRRGSGGLVSGMQAALSASPDAVWVSAAMNDRERVLARRSPGGRISEVPFVAEALHGDFDVRMLPIDGTTFRNAYNAIANSTLWFALHRLYDLPTQPIYDASWRRQWASYVRFNQAFADALAEAAAPGAHVMVQDYHLFLVPRMLRRQREDVRIGFFTHTPWVNPADFGVLPDDVQREIVDGMLGADVLGFHTERWAGLFRETAQSVLGVDAPGVRVFPLGTDPDEMHEQAGRRAVDSQLRLLEETVGDRLLIGRIDRTELSKNVYRGLLAYREVLRTRPEWRGRVVHAVFNNPSREDVPAYREYTARIERLAEEIVDEFETDDWTPLLFEISEEYASALAIMRRCDVVFVNSIRDGMNLVVLEELVLSERDPSVVLSRETGAAEILGDDALLVNPFDVSGTAQALVEALIMPREERAARAERMRAAAVALPPVAWFQAQLDELEKTAG